MLGGHDPRGQSDQFGDCVGDQAWAPHETEAIALGAHCARPCARLATAGMPHYHHLDDQDKEVERMRCATWPAVTSKRMLVHGLQAQPHLNGAIGTIVGAGGSLAVDADSRVGLALGPPHNENLHVPLVLLTTYY